MQALPYAGLAPGIQAVLKRHAAAAHLAGEIFPGDAGLEDEKDAGETDPVVHRRLAALGTRLVFRKQRLNKFP